MGLQLLILGIFSAVCGIATAGCQYARIQHEAAAVSEKCRLYISALALLPLTGGLIGMLWCFLSPPPFSVRVSGPPLHHRNDPTRSIYLGNGCFWHTQYDFVVVVQDVDGAFSGRSDSEVTSLVGY